ncbi:hypothetical protein MHA01_23610 [Marinococcus halophilus]|uniref:LIM zinc-binding domain-containing protein n=1 Tax=Marinococcus halophilus TaxID=1371 RepID=A0A510Y7V7_MARHA|nr:hypothetical protein [Marinococcus halophilus]GEK59456.1 hypothetical protein MHA01_23610 [Marinococcus halophilus]
MEEYLGQCSVCGKEIYCRDGFFEGVHEGGRLYCFECFKQLRQHSV